MLFLSFFENSGYHVATALHLSTRCCYWCWCCRRWCRVQASPAAHNDDIYWCRISWSAGYPRRHQPHSNDKCAIITRCGRTKHASAGLSLRHLNLALCEFNYCIIQRRKFFYCHSVRSSVWPCPCSDFFKQPFHFSFQKFYAELLITENSSFLLRHCSISYLDHSKIHIQLDEQ